jgi:transposase
MTIHTTFYIDTVGEEWSPDQSIQSKTLNSRQNLKKLPEYLTASALSFDAADQRPLQVFFQDEARFSRINIPIACWAPKSQRPTVSKEVVRQYLYAYYAVNPVSCHIFSILAPNCDTETMYLYLDQFSEEYKDYRNIVIMDKASCHTSNCLKSFNNIRFIFLPPYSPELNPSEHLWAAIRDFKLRNNNFGSLDDVQDALVYSFQYLESNKEMVSKLTYFKWMILDI